MVGCNLTSNSAQIGGGVSVRESAGLNVTRTLLQGNTAAGFGGALYADQHGRVGLSSCLMTNNSAVGGQGGAVFVGGSAALIITGGTRGAANYANKGGFLALDLAGTVHASNATFDGNWVVPYGQGGLMYARGNASAAWDACHITGGTHHQDMYGGAFDVRGSASLRLTSTTISHFHAYMGGAISLLENGTVQASNATFVNLTAAEWGGAVYDESIGGRVSMYRGCAFIATSAPYGGAINSMSGSRLALTDVVFANATSAESGGALYVEERSTVSMTGCKLQGCSSPSFGGAVHIRGNARVDMTRCDMSACSSTRDAGGALGVVANASLTLHSCRLHDNKAFTAGGAVALDQDATVTALDCVFSHNACDGRGGALSTASTSSGRALMRLNKCVVAGNSATAAGGIFLCGNASLVLADTAVVNNTASLQGGGIVLESEGFVERQVTGSVRGNRAPSSAEVAVLPTQLRNACVNCTGAGRLDRFVSRLSSDDGLVNASLQLTGTHGLPSGQFAVAAAVEGVVVFAKETFANGTVLMPVKVRKPPGASSVGRRGLLLGVDVVWDGGTPDMPTSTWQHCWPACV